MKILWIIALSLLISISSVGQLVDFKKDQLWADGGIGRFDSPANNDGFSTLLSLNLLKDSTLFTCRYIDNVEFTLFGPKPSNRYTDFSFLIGRGVVGGGGHIMFSTGIGIFMGTERDEFLHSEPAGLGGRRSVYSQSVFMTPAIPLQIDLQFNPFKFIGVGLSIYGNLNLDRPMYGAAMKLSLGKVR